MRYFFLVAPAACTLFLSCTYETEETFFKPIDPPDVNNYSVVLNSFDDKDHNDRSNNNFTIKVSEDIRYIPVFSNNV